MKAKLILLSKNNTDCPEITRVRPISILPVVTKLFELSILDILVKATDSENFMKTQRGFMKGHSTLDNIKDLLDFWWKSQEERRDNKHIQSALVFYYFKSAHDTVPREILIERLYEVNIPWNVISTIKNMLDNFWLMHEGK